MLLKGEELSTQMVFGMIEDKLKSPEVQHYGERVFIQYTLHKTSSTYVCPIHS